MLKPSAVKVLTNVTSKKRLFQELAEIAHSVYGLDAPLTVDALQERENLGPTGVGRGVALPHLRLEKPLDVDAVDRQPVYLVFALVAPKDSGVEHLKALALVSRTMRNVETCNKLRANSDPAALHAVLTEAQGVQAA